MKSLTRKIEEMTEQQWKKKIFWRWVALNLAPELQFADFCSLLPYSAAKITQETSTMRGQESAGACNETNWKCWDVWGSITDTYHFAPFSRLPVLSQAVAWQAKDCFIGLPKEVNPVHVFWLVYGYGSTTFCSFPFRDPQPPAQSCRRATIEGTVLWVF